MHPVIILDTVCLYSFRSTITVTVFVHSFPFHCHFLILSMQLSDDIENFDTILLSKFSIYNHKDFYHMLTSFTAEIALPPHHELIVL